MQPQPKPTAAHWVVRTRIRQIVLGSTARVSGQELYERAYAGLKRPGFNAFEKQIRALNDQLEAEGSTRRVGSTTWFGECAPRRKPRKAPSTFDPST